MPLAADSPTSHVRCAYGPRELEELLLADLELEARRTRADPRLLARPLSIVVPSQSLREHLIAVSVRRAGGALAGVQVLTLAGFARTLIARAGLPTPTGLVALEVIVGRELERDRELAGALAAELASNPLARSALSASVRDLFDAGFEAAHLEAADECLAAEGPEGSGRAVRRARALLALAARAWVHLGDAGCARAGDEAALAAQLVRRSPELTSSRALWIHGFSDATGRVTELLDALVRNGARTYWDACAAAPPAGARAAPVDAGARARPAGDDDFGAPLARALSIEVRIDARPPSAIDIASAPAPADELRAALERIAELVARGTPPERIALCVRDTRAWSALLRRDLARLGLPASGRALAPALEARHAVLGHLGELFARGAELPIGRWLALRKDAGPFSERAELALALRQLGVRDLATLAQLPLDALLGARAELALAIRGGAAPDDERRVTQRIARATLESERAAAGSVLARVNELAALRTVRDHARALEELVATPELASSGASAVLAELLEPLARSLPDGFALTGPELALIWAQALEELRGESARHGGGIACLSVTEARARTFDELFVLGLDRGSFPRAVREDPLLPDRLRRRLAPILPELATKDRGHAEERFLFEQLLHAAPRVHLSWHAQDDDGRAVAPSPFAERWLRELGADALRHGASLHAASRRESRAALPAHEHATLAGLWGSRSDWRAALEFALEERDAASGARDAASTARALAQVRADVLEARDPLRPDVALHAWSGFVGSATARDPRHAPLYVTTLERLARCPWQTLLTRLLRLEPPPDPEPVLAVLDRRRLGELVHRVLDELARNSLGTTRRAAARLEELGDPSAARELAWPGEAELEALVRRHARELLRESGIALEGLAQVAASLALPYLNVAREQRSTIESGEIAGVLEVARPGAPRALAFRADATESGRVLVDYKIGEPHSRARRESTRRAHLARAIARGERLQIAVYARRAGAGAYLYLEPELEADQRRAQLAAADAECTATLDGALATLLDAWDAGTFFPRLLDDKREQDGEECAHCEVAEACSRGDSGEKRRWREWLALAAQQPPASATERTLAALWQLGRAAADDIKEEA